MNDKLKESIAEHFGAELGAAIFDSEVVKRARRRQEYLQLKAQLDAANEEHSARSHELAKNLEPLRRAADARYTEYLRATEALEAQRVSNERALSPLAERIRSLWSAVNSEPAFVDQAGYKAFQAAQWRPIDLSPPPPANANVTAAPSMATRSKDGK